MTPIETLESVYRENVKIVMQMAFQELMLNEESKIAVAKFQSNLFRANKIRSILLKELSEIEDNK